MFPLIWARDRKFNKILPSLSEEERDKYFAMSNSQKQEYKNYVINRESK